MDGIHRELALTSLFSIIWIARQDHKSKAVRMERIAMEFGNAEHLLKAGIDVEKDVNLGEHTAAIVRQLQESVHHLENTITSSLEKELSALVESDNVTVG